MPDSDPLGCFSSMPNGPFLSSPHKTENLTGEPGCISSHLRSAAGTVISCLPFAKLIYLISSSIDLADLLLDTQNVDKTVLYTISVNKHGLDCSRIEHLLTAGGETCRSERTYSVRGGGCISC